MGKERQIPSRQGTGKSWREGMENPGSREIKNHGGQGMKKLGWARIEQILVGEKLKKKLCIRNRKILAGQE